jgi:hypothetical protein
VLTLAAKGDEFWFCDTDAPEHVAAIWKVGGLLGSVVRRLLLAREAPRIQGKEKCLAGGSCGKGFPARAHCRAWRAWRPCRAPQPGP